MAKNENTELAVSNFAAIANSDFNQAVSEELDGLELRCDAIKIVNNAEVFKVPSDTGKSATFPTFEAVILYHHPLNAYYKTAYDGGNNPPDCGSFDGKIGIGDPGGKCKPCPLNKYGSAADANNPKSKAKACKNRRRLYVLREGDFFPMLLSLPPTSLDSFRSYLQKLIGENKRSNSVVTSFSLIHAAKDGMTFSQGVFEKVRDLNPDELTALASMCEQIKEYAQGVGYEADGFEENAFVDPETGEVIEPLGGTDV